MACTEHSMTKSFLALGFKQRDSFPWQVGGMKDFSIDELPGLKSLFLSLRMNPIPGYYPGIWRAPGSATKIRNCHAGLGTKCLPGLPGLPWTNRGRYPLKSSKTKSEMPCLLTYQATWVISTGLLELWWSGCRRLEHRTKHKALTRWTRSVAPIFVGGIEWVLPRLRAYENLTHPR